MTKKELFFQKEIFPYLEDVINYKKILFLYDKTISDLIDIGLIKEREETDRYVDSFIVCGEYVMRFHRYLHYVFEIKKCNEVLYEYNDEKASKERPELLYI